MTIYVVVKDTSSNNVSIGSTVLGVFHNSHDAVECVNKAYDELVVNQVADDTLRESCYISEQQLVIATNDVISAAKDYCPEPDCFFHQNDDTIYSMGFVDGYEFATIKNT
jgi:hypothetical protein